MVGFFDINHMQPVSDPSNHQSDVFLQTIAKNRFIRR